MWRLQPLALYSLIIFFLVPSLGLAAKPPAITLHGYLVPGGMVRGHIDNGWQLSLNGRAVFVDDAGHFAFGFGRAASGSQWLDAKHPDRGHFRFKLQLTQRQFPIQRIDGLPAKQVTPTAPETLARIEKEARAVRQARTIVTALDGFWQDFIRPAQGRISGVYGSQRILNGIPKRPHFGEDIAAAVGTPVKAAADGIVRLASDLYFSGGTIIIDHGAGISSSYLHLSKILVRPGQTVKQGEVIGQVGQSGRATGPHLDWRLNWLDVRLDPSLVVNPNWPQISPAEVIHVQ